MNPADRYLQNDMLPIPLIPGEKRPAIKWKHLQDLLPPFSEAFRGPWQIHPGNGIALLLKPSGLLVVDCDSEAAVREAMGLCEEPCNNVVLSAHGCHMYYEKPEGVPPLRRIQCGASGKIDIMADGYMAVPPSIHPSGHRYTWIKSGDFQPAPEWTCALLREVRERAIDSTVIQPVDVLNAWPNTEAEMFRLQTTLSAINPMLFDYLSGKKIPPDRSRALWLLTNTLIRLQIRDNGKIQRLGDESIAKIVWYGTLGEKPRQRGWQWLCDEIARARLEVLPG